MIRMFPAGVSEMCSLAVACAVTEFEKSSSNGVDTLAYLEAQEAMPKAATLVNAHNLAPKPGVGADCDDRWMQECLQSCPAGLSADLQRVQSSTATAEMSQEVKDLIQSLKLAAQLTKEDLKKVQDVNTLPTFDPDATAGLGQHPLFLQCPRHN